MLHNGTAVHNYCVKKSDNDSINVNWCDFYKQKNFTICKKSLEDSKVRDHNHIDEKFIDLADNFCNFKFIVPRFISVVFHNLAGTDSHLFIKELFKTNGQLTIFPKTNKIIFHSQRKLVLGN